ncbi:hypothetical protein I3842_03G236000 [Carya illinoinensis]|uniref:Uncharacterized protein n=1 Tax=Carya illinoinensis TaxID=32201 RepID=A0A922FKD0_CARIL|nr:hypothetical protein I3842_03G236000 [Carya illinoinensis]
MGIIKLVAFVAGAWDLSFDVYAYAVVFMANICTASIVRIVSGLNTFGLMWCNGIICGPILLFLTSIRGDLQVTLNFPHTFSSGFQAVMVLSCIMAFSINYCGLLTIELGWLLFGGLPFDLLSMKCY